VVVGFEDDEFLLRSGTHALISQSSQTLENTWARANHWALLVVPAGQIPEAATPKQTLDAAEALQQSGQHEAARRHYAAALSRWSDSATLWTARGNLHYTQQQWGRAISDYRKALTLNRALGTTWNNLAYALEGLGCKHHAAITLQCAEALAPDDEQILSSRAELGLKNVSNTPSDPSPRCDFLFPDCPSTR
jgi:tetratricopeptide (TPR) repeat protein